MAAVKNTYRKSITHNVEKSSFDMRSTFEFLRPQIYLLVGFIIVFTTLYFI